MTAQVHVCARFLLSPTFFSSLRAHETVRETQQSFSTPGQRLFYYEAYAHAGLSVDITAKWTNAKGGLVFRGAWSVGNTGKNEKKKGV